jgi:5'-nucleotidase (lipoprotein e(P4) family)
MTRLAYLLATSTLLIAACTTVEDDGADADIIVGEDKADGVPGVELLSFLATTSPIDGAVAPGAARVGYLFYAAAGTKVDLEVTQAGSASGLDTVMKVYGPRGVDGKYAATGIEDDDAGYGKLSKLSGKTMPIANQPGGFYLVEVTTKTAPTEPKKFRLALRCSGSCERPGPAGAIGLDIRWSQKSAEFRALSLQAYNLASERLDALAADGLPAAWAVVLDIDETTLMNVQYQRERAELGTGYSSSTWTSWVQRKAAPPVPGAKSFIEKVRALGGKVVFVTNRKASTECDPTAMNLAAENIRYDAILCRTDTSNKNVRFEAIEDGTAPGLPALTTVMYVGDNIQDFPNLTQEVRNESDAALADFGHRFILIPNPMYGSWESNP